MWPIKRLRTKDFAIDMLFEYEDDDGSMLGGPVLKLLFFQVVHMAKVSTQIHSSISHYDVYKVL